MPYDGEVKNGKIYEQGPNGWGWYDLPSTGTTGPGGGIDTTGDPNDPPVGTTKPGPNGTTLVYLGYGNWDLYTPPTGGQGPQPPAPPVPNAPPGSVWVTQPGTGLQNLTAPDGSIWGTQPVPNAPGPPASAPPGSKWVDQDNGYISLTGPDGTIYETKAAQAPPTTNVTTEVTDMGGGLQLVVTKDQNGTVLSSQVMNKAKKVVTSVTTTQTDIGNNKVRMDTRDQDGEIIDSQTFDKATTPQQDLDLYTAKAKINFDFAEATSAADFERQSELSITLQKMRDAASSADLKARLDSDLKLTNMRIAADARLQAERFRAEAAEAQKNRDFTKAENLLDRALQKELQAERIENEQVQGNLNRATSLKEAAMMLQQRAGEVLVETIGKDPFRFALEARGQATGDRPTPVTNFQDKLRTMVNAPLPTIPGAAATLAQSEAAYNQASAFPTTLPTPTGFGLGKGGTRKDVNKATLLLTGEYGPEAQLVMPGSTVAVEPLHMKRGASMSKMEAAAREAVPKLEHRLHKARTGIAIQKPPKEPVRKPPITTPDVPTLPPIDRVLPPPVTPTLPPVAPPVEAAPPTYTYGPDGEIIGRGPPTGAPPIPELPAEPPGSPPGGDVPQGEIGIRDMPFYQILLKELLGESAANQILTNKPYTLNQEQLGAFGVSPSTGPTTKLSAFQPYGSLLTLPGQNNAPIPVAYKWAGIFKNLLPNEQKLLLSALSLAGGSGTDDANALSQIASATFTGPGR